MRDGLRGLIPKTRARGKGVSMSPKPIAPYKSGLVVLFNASLFTVSLLNFLYDVFISPPGAGLWICSRTSPSLWEPPSHSDQFLSPRLSCITRVCSLDPSWCITYTKSYPIGQQFLAVQVTQCCLLHFPSTKWVLTSAVNSTNVSGNSVTIAETGSQ